MGKRGPEKKPGQRDKYGRLTEKAKDELLQSGYEAEERENMAHVMATRMRLYGLTAQLAKGQEAGSVVGRMRQAGMLSLQQYEAALRYIFDCENYHAAIGAPARLSAMDLNAARGLSVIDTEEAIRREQKARQRWETATRAVQAAQNELRASGNLWGALEVFLIRDQHVYTLEGDLKVALNALARHYRLVGELAA